MSCVHSRIHALAVAVELLLLVSILTLAFPAVAVAETYECHAGTVIDAHGKPVRGVTVTVHRWNNYLGGWADECVDVTDKDGRFSVTVRTWAHGLTYYYLTFEAVEHVEYATVRVPALTGTGGCLDGVFTEYRSEICVPDPMTVVLTKTR